MNAEQVRSYLLYLLGERKLSWPALPVARAALGFLSVRVLKQHWFEEQIPCPKRPFSLPARERWLAARSEELLPVPYSHVVFTLPHEWIALALQNPRLVYGLLFRAVSQTLLTIAADPKHLGARLGFWAVLHTWDQRRQAHPHLPVWCPPAAWPSTRPAGSRAVHRHFFLPVRALAAKFRGQFLALLRRAYRRGRLRLSGSLAPLQEPKAFNRFTWALQRKEWVVYAKKPFSGPQQVIRYLAHYPHRVAIANGRLLRFENGQVTFRWRDSAHGNRQKVMTLDAVEFLRRFLLPVLPRGFVKIRHFGYLANGKRKHAFGLCSTPLPSPPIGVETQPAPRPARTLEKRRCPSCQQGRLFPLTRLSAAQLQTHLLRPRLDTS